MKNRGNLKDELDQGEGETIEFRRTFGNEALRTLCAFANTRGGVLWVGVDDDGSVVGAKTGKESLRDWANRIRNELGIHANLEAVEQDGKHLVCLAVDENADKPVRYRGRAYVRSGSTDRIATQEEETRWVLERSGQSWDAVPDHGTDWTDLQGERIKRFRQMCMKAGRRDFGENEDDKTVLAKLGLVTDDDLPTRAAVLLFGKQPQKHHSNAILKVGRFRSETTIVDDREIGSTLVDQVEQTLTYFREHLQTRFEFSGEPAREVIWEYPLEALREAVLNAVCHRDYLDSGHTQIRWHDDRLLILNPGGLPAPLRLEDLKKPHRSVLRNRLIAEAFYNMGWIERWGSGIQKILNQCEEAGLPEPEFEEKQGAFWLTFRKDALTEERLLASGLNGRQVRAVLWIKEKGRISNSDYQELVGVSPATAKRDLTELVKKGFLSREGKGPSAFYILGQSGHNRVTIGSEGAKNEQGGDE